MPLSDYLILAGIAIILFGWFFPTVRRAESKGDRP
jgi:hypothetical protein